MKCRGCGRSNLVDASYCEQCGERLMPGAPRTAVMPAPLDDPPTVRVQGTPRPGVGPGGLPLGLAAHELPAVAPSSSASMNLFAWLVMMLMATCCVLWLYMNRAALHGAFTNTPATPASTAPTLANHPATRLHPMTAASRPPSPPRASAEALASMRQRGIDLALQRHFRQAMEPLGRAVSANPRDAVAVFYLFTCYRGLEDRPQHGSTAYQLAGRVLRLTPHSQFARGARQYISLADHPQVADDDVGVVSAPVSAPEPGVVHNDPAHHSYQFYGPPPPPDPTPAAVTDTDAGMRHLRRTRRFGRPLQQPSDAPPFAPQGLPPGPGAPAVTYPNSNAPNASPSYPVMPNPFRYRPYNPSQQPGTSAPTPLFP